MDSVWGGDRVGTKSTSAAHVFLNEALVHNHSRPQTTVAGNSAELDMYAMGSGACEGLLIKSLLGELLTKTIVPVSLYSDSWAEISSQIRLGVGKLKHGNSRYMLAQGMLREGRLIAHKIPGAANSSYSDCQPLHRHRGLRS